MSPELIKHSWNSLSADAGDLHPFGAHTNRRAPDPDSIATAWQPYADEPILPAVDRRKRDGLVPRHPLLVGPIGMSPLGMPSRSYRGFAPPPPLGVVMLPTPFKLAIFNAHEARQWDLREPLRPAGRGAFPFASLPLIRKFEFEAHRVTPSPGGRFICVQTGGGLGRINETLILRADRPSIKAYQVRGMQSVPVLFAADDRYALIQVDGRHIALFDFAVRRHLPSLAGSPWPLVEATASADQKRLALTFEDHWARREGEAQIQIYRRGASERMPFASLLTFRGASRAAYSLRDQTFAWASAGGWAAVHDHGLEHKKEVSLLEQWVAFDAKNGLLVTRAEDGEVKLRQAQAVLHHGLACSVSELGNWPITTQWRFSIDGRRLFAKTPSGRPTLFGTGDDGSQVGESQLHAHSAMPCRPMQIIDEHLITGLPEPLAALAEVALELGTRTFSWWPNAIGEAAAKAAAG